MCPASGYKDPPADAFTEATVEDAQAAQKAVAAAMAVLKEFYAKASTATAFVQMKVLRCVSGVVATRTRC